MLAEIQVLPNPPGTTDDYYRHVEAAIAVIQSSGVTYEVDRPEVVPVADVIDFFSSSDRRMFGVFGVEQCFRVYHVEADD